jgi:tRNA threonylcarbamoyladenosine biosynthesis protein TsaB
MILTIRTDNPEAEIGLYESGQQVAYKKWQAHRELSSTIHKVIYELLESAGKEWADIAGIIYFKGPGSFTGLRIGASVANALAESNNAPISNQNSEDWIGQGLKALAGNETDQAAIPEYGGEPHVTAQKK